MSLVDKLEGIQRGDLVLLRTGDGLEVAGYVNDYSPKKIRLSTTNPFNDPSEAGFWSWMSIGNHGNSKTYSLKYFDKYEIVRKHSSK